MAKVKLERYDAVIDRHDNLMFDENENGEWVRYSDVMLLLNKYFGVDKNVNRPEGKGKNR